MAEDIFPAQQPSFMGEWTYNSANTAPPATAQLRLNTSSQANATSIYVHNITFNGIDASTWLMEMIPGYVIRLEEKGLPARWHTFTISGNPIQQSGYVELKVTWLAGGQNLTTSVMVSVVSSVVRVTGNAAQASVGTASVSAIIRKDALAPVTGMAAVASTGNVSVLAKQNVSIPVTAPVMKADSGSVDIVGHIYLPGMAYPSDTPVGFSPGMTLRQFYAGQAIMGFISASNVPASNLMGGKLAEYAFKLADSLIAYEKGEATGKPPTTIVGRPKLVG